MMTVCVRGCMALQYIGVGQERWYACIMQKLVNLYASSIILVILIRYVYSY